MRCSARPRGQRIARTTGLLAALASLALASGAWAQAPSAAVLVDGARAAWTEPVRAAVAADLTARGYAVPEQGAVAAARTFADASRHTPEAASALRQQLGLRVLVWIELARGGSDGNHFAIHWYDGAAPRHEFGSAPREELVALVLARTATLHAGPPPDTPAAPPAVLPVPPVGPPAREVEPTPEPTPPQPAPPLPVAPGFAPATPAPPAGSAPVPFWEAPRVGSQPLPAPPSPSPTLPPAPAAGSPAEPAAPLVGAAPASSEPVAPESPPAPAAAEPLASSTRTTPDAAEAVRAPAGADPDAQLRGVRVLLLGLAGIDLFGYGIAGAVEIPLGGLLPDTGDALVLGVELGLTFGRSQLDERHGINAFQIPASVYASWRLAFDALEIAPRIGFGSVFRIGDIDGPQVRGSWVDWLGAFIVGTRAGYRLGDVQLIVSVDLVVGTWVSGLVSLGVAL